MNPAFLPPQQGNFNLPSNGFAPRSSSATAPQTTVNKIGPTMGAPSPTPPGMPQSVNGPPVNRDSTNPMGISAYAPGMPQKNNQLISGNGPSNQPYLGKVDFASQPSPPQFRQQGPLPNANPNHPNMNQVSNLPGQNPGLQSMQGNFPPKQFPTQAPGQFSNAMPPLQAGMPPRQGLSMQGPGSTPLPVSGNLPQMPNSAQMPFPAQQSNFGPQQPHMPPPKPQGNFGPQMGHMQTHMPPPNPQGNFGPQPGQMPPPPQGQFPPQNHFPPSLQGQMPPNRMPPNADHLDQLNISNQMQTMSLSGSKPGGPMQPPQPPGYMQQQPRGMQQGPGYPQMGQPDGYMGQTARKLDPDQMPSFIQVIRDDQASRSGLFVTNEKGLVPPLVTTNFVVQDQGNCSPRFIRSTMYNVPISQDILKHTAVPFSLVISPMARVGKDEYPPPIVNFGELGPVRCIRCKAYMCPYMQFIDSGRRFQCLFCKATTDVPAQYFQHLDHTGQRMDKYERPELVLGSYEFVATADYCRNNTLPKPPAIIFVIDVSYNNIKSGMVQLLCSKMKEIIKNLPVDQGHEKSNMRVGFITYNSSVHFYNIKGTLAGPQMMIVGDTQEMFMPLLDGFLCTPEESEAVIDSLMEQIPTIFAETKETEIVLLPAILAGLEALKASDTTGKLLVFHSTLPSADAPGKLRNRDDRKLLGTDKEKTVLTPQTQAYNQLGQDCVAAGCAVDLFIFNNSYIDIATISQVSRLTGGEVFKYTYFQADIDGDRLITDVIMDISRPIAFDGIMRVRTSTGVRPTDFYGYFYMSNTTDMELAALDCDKGIAIEIKHDDKLSEEEGVYIQAALLYTSCSGQRRLRIMNLSLKTCAQMADLYRSCDLDTIINFFAKQATYKLSENNPKAVKDALVNRSAQILATYRKNCASPTSAGQLILPECMKLLPLYTNCLLRCDALSGGQDMTLDDRAFVMQAVLTMDVRSSTGHLYPTLIPLHEIDLSTNPVETPLPIRCIMEKLSEQGVYLLENGIHMFLWVGLGANPEFVQNVFGAPSAIQIDIERPHLPELDNPLSIEVRRIINDLRIERHRYMRLTVVRQREKLEPVFKHFLVEDRGTDGSPGYVDFLCHMHKEIRALLS
ncbi:hypothetical protein HUJ04_004007 [Dendroctonus ponderosae]|uniref:Protein transport protein Sec24C n=2 Tax=Dendroctonus ponderosae TaxID=77166 RepID=A0AAR5P9L8_DENPD|nr:hypothetical protein HUJ04_004007 [Dendroctonus ponderosae]